MEVTVSRPGRSQEEIIETVPLTAKKGVQVPRLVTPLSNPEFVPSLESSEVSYPVIRFPSLFDPDLNPTEEMPIQKRSIDIASVLGTSAPEPSGTSPPAPPPGFSQGKDVMRKKKEKEERSRVMMPVARRGHLHLNLQRLRPLKRGRVKMTELSRRL